jgi:Holliday junction resolvasome RuvABC endonuclease subunit|tara:strand:- start:1068 stop:1601 length:534 start_codon:yes stop_codon:yes gene_type:complete
MILGLDISTSITGFAIVDKSGKLLYTGHIDTRKEKNIFDKANKVRVSLLELKNLYSIEFIFIEQPFTFFNSGGSSAKTMAVLQRFNGMVSWIVNEMFKIEPDYIEALKARKLCSIKIARGQNTKKVVLEAVLDMEPTFEVEYTRHGNPKAGYCDRADGVVLAKAGSIICQDIKNYKS